jgi:hypothetical protein
MRHWAGGVRRACGGDKRNWVGVVVVVAVYVWTRSRRERKMEVEAYGYGKGSTTVVGGIYSNRRHGHQIVTILQGDLGFQVMRKKNVKSSDLSACICL